MHSYNNVKTLDNNDVSIASKCKQLPCLKLVIKVVNWIRDVMDIEPFELSLDVKNRVIKLMQAFGLELGSHDFIVDKNCKLIFPVVNSTDNWAFIEDTTGLLITEAISKLIMEETRS